LPGPLSFSPHDAAAASVNGTGYGPSSACKQTLAVDEVFRTETTTSSRVHPHDVGGRPRGQPMIAARRRARPLLVSGIIPGSTGSARERCLRLCKPEVASSSSSLSQAVRSQQFVARLGDRPVNLWSTLTLTCPVVSWRDFTLSGRLSRVLARPGVPGRHGKDMVRRGSDGSSPSEGSAKSPQIGVFSLGSTCMICNLRRVWSRLRCGATSLARRRPSGARHE
jgi:hypothetical protein